MVESGKKNKAPALPPDVQVKIGEKLKAIYDDVVRQPVPDRFRDLLSQLDAAPIAGGDASSRAVVGGQAPLAHGQVVHGQAGHGKAGQAQAEAEGSGK